MEFSEYQKRSRETAVYPEAGNNFVYPALGLAGETGEVIEKIKKLLRNEGVTKREEIAMEKIDEIKKEMGDTMWYLAQLATELDIDLDTVASENIKKILSRKERNTLHSEGDNR
jgi:NTP pyrophosphatase (non-canonical NTP hydrolase)